MREIVSEIAGDFSKGWIVRAARERSRRRMEGFLAVQSVLSADLRMADMSLEECMSSGWCLM